MPASRPVLERLLSRIEIVDLGLPEPRFLAPGSCWLVTGHLDTGGYGRIGLGGRHGGTGLAHVVACEHLVGPSPEGFHVDHLCHGVDLSCPGGSTCPHRRCINPDHLTPVLPWWNHARGRGNAAGIAAAAAAKLARTRCIHGHEFDEVNTVIRGDGARACRACHRASDRRYKARRRELVSA